MDVKSLKITVCTRTRTISKIIRVNPTSRDKHSSLCCERKVLPALITVDYSVEISAYVEGCDELQNETSAIKGM